MHLRLKHSAVTVKEVRCGDKVYQIRFENGEAYAGRQQGLQAIRDGIAVEGDKPDPAARFERNRDGSHGKALDLFASWVTEV
jgi:hypothetical protein